MGELFIINLRYIHVSWMGVFRHLITDETHIFIDNRIMPHNLQHSVNQICASVDLDTFRKKFLNNHMCKFIYLFIYFDESIQRTSGLTSIGFSLQPSIFDCLISIIFKKRCQYLCAITRYSTTKHNSQESRLTFF